MSRKVLRPKRRDVSSATDISSEQNCLTSRKTCHSLTPTESALSLDGDSNKRGTSYLGNRMQCVSSSQDLQSRLFHYQFVLPPLSSAMGFQLRGYAFQVFLPVSTRQTMVKEINDVSVDRQSLLLVDELKWEIKLLEILGPR